MYIQSVIIHEMMYVGGGRASPDNNRFIIMAYHITSQEWSLLPPYTARSFAMTVVHNKLTLVGGCDRDYNVTKLLGVWDADGRKWTHPYTRMPTPRSNSSAVVYKKWLIVAGGWNGASISRVEVLDISTNLWYRAPLTPVPWSSMRSAVVGDIWYLMGGSGNGITTAQMYRVSLSALTSHINNTNENIWNTILSLGLWWSTPLCMGKSLLAVGGRKPRTIENVSTILRFTPVTPDRNEWREVGQLPHPLYECTCTQSCNQLFLTGGSQGADKMYIGTI